MNQITCKQCKWWNKEPEIDYGLSIPTEYHKCLRMFDASGGEAKGREPAYITDYEGYGAVLCTLPTFNCSSAEK